VLLPRPRVRAGGRELPPRVRRKGVGAGRTVRRAIARGPGGRVRHRAAGDHCLVPRSRRGGTGPARYCEQLPDQRARARLGHRRPRAPPRRDLAGALSRVSVEIGQKARRTLTLTPDHVATYAKLDRKSTRLNSSHVSISYAVFCLKKK